MSHLDIVGAVDRFIHAAVVDVAAAAAIKAAKITYPWLNLPIISTLFSWAVSVSARQFSSFLEQAAAFAVIDFKVSGELLNYQKALGVLKAVQPLGDPDATEKALAEFKSRLAALIRY